MPMVAQVQFAAINGHRYSRTSLSLLWGGRSISGFTAVNYKTTRAPGISHGSRSLPQGRTRGKTTFTLDIEMYEEEFQGLLGALTAIGNANGVGPLEVESTIVLARFESKLGTVTTTFLGAQITEPDSSNGDNDDQSKRKLTLSVMNILENGMPLIRENSPLGF